jgi:hypothetical protein
VVPPRQHITYPSGLSLPARQSERIRESSIAELAGRIR